MKAFTLVCDPCFLVPYGTHASVVNMSLPISAGWPAHLLASVILVPDSSRSQPVWVDAGDLALPLYPFPTYIICVRPIVYLHESDFTDV